MLSFFPPLDPSVYNHSYLKLPVQLFQHVSYESLVLLTAFFPQAVCFFLIFVCFAIFRLETYMLFWITGKEAASVRIYVDRTRKELSLRSAVAIGARDFKFLK